MGNSIHTRLRINNHTSSDIVRTWITDVCDYDWDGVSRPDNNMQNRYIPISGSIEEREEVNARASNCPFRMGAVFSDGREICFRIHQKHAIGCCPGFQHERSVGVNICYNTFGLNGLEITFSDDPTWRPLGVPPFYQHGGTVYR